jgi:hypothetical protein
MRLTSRIRSVLGPGVGIGHLFEAPTVAAIAQRLGAADRGGLAAKGLGRVVRAARRPDRLPLSSAKLRIWIVDRLAGRGAAYNVPFAMRLPSAVDAEALAGAVRDVLCRHEVLRTVYPDTDGEPRQLIIGQDQAEVRFEVVYVAPGDLDAWLSRAARYCFDLGRELPVRAYLIHVPGGEPVFFALMHHIAVDGWSMRPLARDLAAAYHARLSGQAPRWPVLTAQYADFALWQSEAMSLAGPAGAILKDQLAFWVAELAGVPDELMLPLDRPRPPLRDGRGELVSFSVSPDVSTALAALGRERQATLFMVLQAAVATLLHHIGAGTDIPLGSPVAGRGDEALDELVGFFVNTVVLRTDVSGDPPFRDLLARVRAADLRAWASQDVPFERVVEEIGGARSAAVHPLFQVMFSLDDGAIEPLTLDGRPAEPLTIGTGTAKFDLTITFRQSRPYGLTGEISYATDIFDAATVTTMAQRLSTVLTAVATAPDTPISNLTGAGQPAEFPARESSRP